MQSENLLNQTTSTNGKEHKSPDLQMHSFDLFNDRSRFVNGTRAYYAYFKKIASQMVIRKIDCERAMKWVETHWANVIENKHIREDYSSAKKKLEVIEVQYILKGELLVRISDDDYDATVYYTETNKKLAQEIFDGIKKFPKKSGPESFIHLVVQQQGEIMLELVNNKKPNVVLNQNYNDDLAPVHELVVKSLKKKGNNGLILFHGKPGTGKSTYLRHLVHTMRSKSIIFLSPKLAQNLDSPSLTKLLIQNQNSLLIIEDAEELITSRGKGNDSSISMLLNLTDGILGESLGIHIICTFNTALTNIDKALLRKGRLIALYEFNELAKDIAQKLSDDLGYKNIITKNMTLAEIFHQNQADFNFERSEKIGFVKS